jgi:hypothetical protein
LSAKSKSSDPGPLIPIKTDEYLTVEAKFPSITITSDIVDSDTSEASVTSVSAEDSSDLPNCDSSHSVI